MKRHKYDYDLAVIGAGSGGLVAAVGATKLGLSVALVEGGRIGGDCLNYGCVPSKALLHVAKEARAIRAAGRLGLETGSLEVDYARVKERVSEVQEIIREHEDARWFRNMGMDVHESWAKFKDPHTLDLGDRELTARTILVATGSRPAVPPVDGLEDVGYVTNEKIFELETLPARLGVIGGGPIGIEMAWAHNHLGSEVTVFEFGPSILGKDDPDMSKIVHDSMIEDGVGIQTRTKVTRVEKVENGKRIHWEQEGKTGFTDVDTILVAAGRKPNIEKLNLKAAGVRAGKQGIKIDPAQRTSTSNIYAVGDVTGGYQFTHAASLEAGTFIKSAVFHLPAKTSYDVFPWVTYTEPELASVGLNETSARAKGIPYDLAETEFADNDRAIAEDRRVGKIKVLLSRSVFPGIGGGKILGAQIVGPNAGNLVHEYALAMKTGTRASALSSTVHAYPTLAEINKRAVSVHLGEKLFTNRTRRLLSILFGYEGRLEGKAR